MSAPIEEIAPGTWRLGSLFGGRNLYQYLIADGGSALLVDAGTGDTPREVIVPALRALDISPDDVSTIVVTHPDLDHQGGVAGLLERLGSARVMCGFEDRPLVSDPEALVRDRYGAYTNDHGMGYPDDALDEMRAIAGRPVDVDRGLVGGESLRVGGRELVVHHVPGHSAGHLALYEPATRILFSSDAVHGAMCPDAEGHPALPPTYEMVDAYLSTLDLLAEVGADSVHSGHWPALDGVGFAAFLAESREFVDRLESALLGALEGPISLAVACEAVDAAIGPFGADPVNLMFAVHGHLRRMCRSGRAKVLDPEEHPLRFVGQDPG